MAESNLAPMPASEELRRRVEDYCQQERNPALGRFSVHGPFTLAELWKSNTANVPGCYAIYGEDGSLRYIGMSLSNVGDRIGSHFSAGTQKTPFWAKGPKATFVEVIEVIEPWEAPSLEEYLIEHM